MLLAPWRQHGDHAQAHREATGGEEEECEDGVEGREEDGGQDFGAQGFARQEGSDGEEVLRYEEVRRYEEGFEQVCGEEGADDEERVEPDGEAARGVQPEARLLPHEGAGGDGAEGTREDAALRGAEARGESPALRLPPRAGRRDEVVGGAEGAELRSQGAAAGDGGGGPPHLV